ncbi:MAG: sigma 54-interacting transcriptional regulator [Clostridiales bacterium]|nr:sigma 54-interacting transcriptional regulator [Clostridiales bacterium]
MFKEIIGKSKSSEQVRAFISKASKLDWPVLLIGETGVGKEVVAWNIHHLSSRKSKPFVPVNLASIPFPLAESELFGHRKGAFTDAKEEKTGLIEDCGGGTVFLDEITECSLDLQAKLLRLLEYRELRRVGETTMRNVDARFILATNKEPLKEIKQGRLRRDLYYRINVLKLRIPALRERKEDIPLFIEKFLQELKEGFREEKRLSSKAWEKIMDYSFPGNVRELENLIRRAYIHAGGKEIKPEDISEEEEEEEEEEIPVKLFKEMVIKGQSFWQVVHRPFLQRDLNRKQVKNILSLGLKETGGSYKKLFSLFHGGEGEKDYKRFMRILKLHRLQ